MRRIFILLLILITCGGLIFYFLNRDSYKVYTVKRELLVKSVYATGVVKKGEEVEVKSQVAGYVEKIFKDTGESVKKGELLAIIKNEPLKKEIEQIEEQIKRVSEKLKPGSPFRKSYEERIKAQEKKLQLLSEKLKRREYLYKKELISKESYEELKTQYESELYTLKALKEEYKKVLRDLENELKVLRKKREYLLKESEKYEIRSPIDGVILKRNAEVGDYVNTFMETKPLFVIGEEGKAKTLIEIDEEYAPLVRKGQKVLVKLEGYPDKVFVGRIKKVYGKIDERKKTLTAELSVEYDVEPISGMSVEANVILKEKKALAIPIKAVKEGYVILLKGNEKIKRKVKLGERFGDFVEVLSGLKEGDKILIEE
ncbi:efflux RND transporter periplasmic adaptor subunit [Aquifex sp.]